MNIFVVVGQDADGTINHVEILDACPRWDLKSMGQTCFNGNVNGGDSIELK